MATPTELYINAELPKRPYTAQYPLTPGHVPVATGVGLEVSARQLDVTDVANAASEQYVNDAIDALVDGAPAALDTLNELAAAINDDENYASTVTTALGNRLRVDVDTQGLSATEQQNGLTNLGVTEVITGASIDGSGLITLAKNGTNPDDTIQVPTAVDSLSFNATTGEMTIGYTNGVADSTITVASNEVTDTVFRIKDNGDSTKKIAFEAGNITTATTRLITMPNVDVNLGDDYINASYSVVNGYLSLHRRKGPPSTDILLNPNITIIYGNTTIVGGTTYAIGQLILGITYPLVANITLTLSTATKPIKIYVGNYKGTITFAGGFVWTPEGANIASFYPTPGSVLEFLPGENDFLGPNWILFEQQNGLYEAADFKLIKNNDWDKTVTFNLSSITGNKIITMPDTAVNLGGIPVSNSINSNSVTGTYAAITSGLTNTASGQYSSVLNGSGNSASGLRSSIVNGSSNIASGQDSCVLGGTQNTASHLSSKVITGHKTESSMNAEVVKGFLPNSTDSTFYNGDKREYLIHCQAKTTGPGYYLTTEGTTSTINGNNAPLAAFAGTPSAQNRVAHHKLCICAKELAPFTLDILGNAYIELQIFVKVDNGTYTIIGTNQSNIFAEAGVTYPTLSVTIDATYKRLIINEATGMYIMVAHGTSISQGVYGA